MDMPLATSDIPVLGRIPFQKDNFCYFLMSIQKSS